MVKLGGTSYPNTINSKRGIITKFKCSICNRIYKLEYYKNRHEKLCIEYHNKK